MSKNKPIIFVVGNEKGGAGKSTISMHLIAGLLESGNNRVVSIDTDSRQHSLTTYINNRQQRNLANSREIVDVPEHFVLKEESTNNLEDKHRAESDKFAELIDSVENRCDYIVVDTPGSYTNYSRIAHSYADNIITPINDSFLDLDVIAKINPNNLNMSTPSIYSQMVWEQKISRASRDGGSINWFVLRNRLSNLDAVNKRNMADAVSKLSKRLAFKVAPGFCERVIFRELFLQGLTLLDLDKVNLSSGFNMSHVAARQELRNFLKTLSLG